MKLIELQEAVVKETTKLDTPPHTVTRAFKSFYMDVFGAQVSFGEDYMDVEEAREALEWLVDQMGGVALWQSTERESVEFDAVIKLCLKEANGSYTEEEICEFIITYNDELGVLTSDDLTPREKAAIVIGKMDEESGSKQTNPGPYYGG